MKKGILCLAIATAITSAGMPTVAHGEETLESAQARYDSAVAQYNLGSAGFFQYLANQGDADAKQAYDIITAEDNSLQDGSKQTVDYSVYTQLGAANDATNLENMKKAVDELNDVNTYRKKENTTEGTNLVDLKVTSSLMAISQYQLNYSKGVAGHSQAFNVSENIAWGYSNPFDGWYDDEKAEFKKGNVSAAGHYLNIVNKSYTTMGYSYVAGSGVQYGSAYGQTFDYSLTRSFTGNAVSVTEYKAKFNTYYNAVKQELADAKKALEDAGVTVPDQNNPEEETPNIPDNSGTTSSGTTASGSNNAGTSNAGTVSQKDSAIKDTAAEGNYMVLISLMACGLAFVAVVGKKRRA